MRSNIVRRGDRGLGRTAAGGNTGSFAGYERAAAAPPAPAAGEGSAAQPYGHVNGLPAYTFDEVDREMRAKHGQGWAMRDEVKEWVCGYDGNPDVWHRISDIDAADPSKRPSWAQEQQNRELRGHDFYPTRKRLERVPALYATDDTVARAGGKVCYEHYFSPTDDFYVVELDRETGEAFGIWKNQYGETELTYVSLPELEARSATARNGLPHYFERDTHFTVQRAARAMPEQYAGCAAHRLSGQQYAELSQAYQEWQEHARAAHADDFAVEQIEAHALEQRRLSDQLDAVAERFGIAIIAKRPELSFHQIHTFNRGDWVDPDIPAEDE